MTEISCRNTSLKENFTVASLARSIGFLARLNISKPRQPAIWDCRGPRRSTATATRQRDSLKKGAAARREANHAAVRIRPPAMRGDPTRERQLCQGRFCAQILGYGVPELPLCCLRMAASLSAMALFS